MGQHVENMRIIQDDLTRVGLLRERIPRKLKGVKSFERLLKRFRLANPTRQARIEHPRKQKKITPSSVSTIEASPKRKKIVQYLSDDDSEAPPKKRSLSMNQAGKRKKRKRESVILDSSPEEQNSIQTKVDKVNTGKPKGNG